MPVLSAVCNWPGEGKKSEGWGTWGGGGGGGGGRERAPHFGNIFSLYIKCSLDLQTVTCICFNCVKPDLVQHHEERGCSHPHPHGCPQSREIQVRLIHWHSFFVSFFLYIHTRTIGELTRIGRFDEAGLHEWIPFVIFRARSRERSQRHFRADFWVGVALRCV